MIINNKTEQEKRDIIVNEIDKSMFVEAGAGAGKSTLIVARIINQLKSGIEPCELVAITFTNAATHELKERIVKAALKEKKKTDLSDTERKNIEAAIDNIDQMQISTIHSFCNRILKERSLDAGMSMDLNLIDENELQKLKDESFILWAEGLKRSDWEILLKAQKYRSGALEVLKNMMDQLLHISDDTDIAISLPLVDEDTFKNTAVKVIDEFKQRVVECVADAYYANVVDFDDIPDDWFIKSGVQFREKLNNDDLKGAIKIIVSAKEANLIKAPKKDYLKDKVDTAAIIATKGKITKAAIDAKASELLNKSKEIIRELLTFVEDNFYTNSFNLTKLLAGYENYIYAPYIEYAKKAKEYFIESLGPDVLSNDLLVQRTYRLLKNSDEAISFFGNKFKCIYVDEFQDTDHVQEAFIRMLTSDVIDKDKLKDGALFVVGDPKQSIYRFRGAEPEVYFKTKEFFAGKDNAYVIELQNNYRSNDRIIDWVNWEFEDRNITEGTEYVPMNVIKSIPDDYIDDNTICGIYTNQFPYEASKDMDVYNDALNVTNLILNLVNCGYTIVDYDEDNNKFKRNIEFRDFLVLCQNMKNMDIYAEYFNQFGIPFVMDSKQVLSGERYLEVFRRIYNYLVKPYDRITIEGAREALYSLNNSYAYIDEMLEEMLNKTADMMAVSKLRYLQNNFKKCLKNDEDIPEVDMVKYQTRITQMVEKVISTTSGSANSICQGITDYINTKIEHELVMDGGINSVRFMNLHKAKGLEGNIVIWTNRCESATFKGGKISTGGTFYPSAVMKIKDNDSTLWVAYNKDENLINIAKEADASEKIRLEYVAATRAKQALIVMDRLTNDPAFFTDDYDLGDKSVANIINMKKNSIINNPAVKIENDLVSFVGANNEKLKKSVFTSESPSQFEDESAGKPEEKAESVVKKSDLVRPVGDVFGTVMHRTFELLINRIAYTKDYLDEYIGESAERLIDACAIQAINENIKAIPADEVEIYKNFLHEVSMAYGNWWYKEKMPEKISDYYTELPFSYFVNDEGDEASIWRHGIADLVIKMKDESILIIDYKSDTDKDYPDEKSFCDRLTGKYSGQINMYKEAIAKAFKCDETCIKAMLISFSQKELEKGEKVRLRTVLI